MTCSSLTAGGNRASGEVEFLFLVYRLQIWQGPPRGYGGGLCITRLSSGVVYALATGVAMATSGTNGGLGENVSLWGQKCGKTHPHVLEMGSEPLATGLDRCAKWHMD